VRADGGPRSQAEIVRPRQANDRRDGTGFVEIPNAPPHCMSVLAYRLRTQARHAGRYDPQQSCADPRHSATESQ
jgi:hypothetical protein